MVIADNGTKVLLAWRYSDCWASAAAGLVVVTTEAPVAIDTEGAVTCPATLTLSYASGGGAPGTLLASTQLSAICTDRGLMPIDASGDFDGTSFTLAQGSQAWQGSLAGGTVTLTGGPGGSSYTLRVP